MIFTMSVNERQLYEFGHLYAGRITVYLCYLVFYLFWHCY